MRHALACLGVIGFVSFGALEARAHAPDFSVSLEYAAPAGCPDAAALEALVSARLGYDPFAETATDHLAVRITPRGTSLEGQIEWHDASGKWVGDQAFHVARAECRGLTRTIALALAVQIQLLADANAAPHTDAPATPDSGQARADQTPPAPPSPAPAAPPAAPPPVQAPVSSGGDTGAHPESPSRGRGPRPVFAIGLGTSAALGMSSSPVLLERAFGSLAGEHWSVELGFEGSLPATTRRADGAGVEQQALLGTAAGCAALKPWFVCVVASAGEIKMAGKDVDRPSSAVVPIFDAGLRVGVTQMLTHRLFFNARVAALVHVARWTPRLDEVPVWQAPLFAAAGGIDLGVNLF